MVKRVFIDGEAGTTGLQIHARLKDRRDIELVSIPSEHRKDAARRAERLNSADLVILCLPDDAAREAVSLIMSPAVKVIDASTAHRVADGWTYGFPECAPSRRAEIVAARRVSNPGCWPTGAIALLKPLVSGGLLDPGARISIHGVSGYSGGGKAMIEEFEDPASPRRTEVPYRLYGLSLEHKHVPEMRAEIGLSTRPLFSPAVGRYAQGMLVETPLHIDDCAAGTTAARIREALADAYAGETFVEVATAEETAAISTLAPEGLNGTNRLRLHVFGAASSGQVRLVALLDNLGKGASGAAVQSMNLMLGLEETAGLS